MAAKKYSWVLNPTDGMLCFADTVSFQTVTKLWELTEATPFHDAELVQATKDINKILSALEKKNKDLTRKLSFIRFGNQHFLVWARYGVGQLNDEETVIRELKLKVE